MWTKTQKERLGSIVSIAGEILESPDDTDISFCAGILATVQALLGDSRWLKDAARIRKESRCASDEPITGKD